MEAYEAVPGAVGALRVPSFTSSQSCDIIVMGVSGSAPSDRKDAPMALLLDSSLVPKQLSLEPWYANGSLLWGAPTPP